jgi:ABC-type branched-subunit amino acid transport system substrate-binding protein
LNQRDDSGVIARALPHIYDLLSQTPFFFSPTGETVFEKIYIPLLQKKALTVLFPSVGMRGGVDRNSPVVWLRPPYSFEIEALIHYAVHTLKQTKIALFFEESAWGLEAKQAAEKILKESYDLKPCASASYPPSTVIVQQAVSALKESRPRVVICISSGRPTYNFIREALNQEMHAVNFLGLSRVAHVAPQLKSSRGVQLVTASIVPNPYKSKLPIVQEYRKCMQQFLRNKGLSTSSLEGFIAGSLLGYFLQQPGVETVPDLFKKIIQTKHMVFKGLVLQYKKKTLSWSVWLNTGVENEWYEYSNG